MITKFKSFLSRTKDRRLKFNIIGGKTLVNMLLISTVLYMILKIIDNVFFTDLSQYNLNPITLFITTILSFHYSRLGYYFHYQNEQIDKTLNNSDEKSFLTQYLQFKQLYWFNQINYLTLLSSNIILFFGIAVFPIFALTKSYIPVFIPTKNDNRSVIINRFSKGRRLSNAKLCF